MRKVVSFSSGRLGNLMFCVATGKYYADKHGCDYYLLNNSGHNNFLSTLKDGIFKDIKIIDRIDKSKYCVVPENHFYDPITVNTTRDVYIDGYRECPKYWDDDKEFIFKLFKPESGLINAIKKTYGINFSEYVCINVRRGDYEKADVRRRLGLLDVQYFYNCIDKFPKNQKFLIVSDDIKWCKENFFGEDFLFADKVVNGYDKMYVDLWIQTLCAHNIISNSTFSWWGAYLNKTKGRKVYYPYRFFKIVGDKTKIPQNDNWIEVPAIWDPYLPQSHTKKDIEGSEMNIEESHIRGIKNVAKRFGADINNPKTISDKLNWLKLHDVTELKVKCADKIRVREYCKEKLGKDICVPILKVYDKPEDINFDELPKQFVLKCNHGSSFNIIVMDKSKENRENDVKKLKQWISKDFATDYFYEMHYHFIEKKCYAETLLENDIVDYKIWCFNGEPKFFSMGSGGGHGAINHYDMEGNFLPKLSRIDYPSDASKKYTIPEKFNEMVSYAKKLSEDFMFVRVDFYYVDNTIYLGELTFIPGAGNVKYADNSMNIAVGDMLNLNKRVHKKNKNVVYTCICGGYDSIQPLSVKNTDFDYVCYTDKNITSNFWEIRPIPGKLKSLDNPRINRYIKTHPHEFFPDYELSVYIDGNVDIKRDLDAFIASNCSKDKGVLFAGQHPSRKCIYEESKAVLRLKKDAPDKVNSQMEVYREEGFPKDYGLSQNCIMIRYHNEESCKAVMEAWWKEISSKSYRDQLSLFYTLWKYPDTKYVLFDKSFFNGPVFLWGKIHKKVARTRATLVVTNGVTNPQSSLAAKSTISGGEITSMVANIERPKYKPMLKVGVRTPRTKSMKKVLSVF